MSRDLSIYDVIAIVLRRLPVLIAAGVLGVGLGFYAFQSLPENYTAEGLLLIGTEPVLPGSEEEEPLPADWRIGTERDAITSPAILGAALDSMDLPEDYRLQRTLAPFLETLDVLLQSRNRAINADEVARRELIYDLKRALVVGASDDSFVVNISLSSADTEFNANFVNALMDIYVAQRKERVLATKVTLIDMIDREKAEIDDKILEKEAELTELLDEPGAEAKRQVVRLELNWLKAVRASVAETSERVHLSADGGGIKVLSEARIPRNGSSMQRAFVMLAILISTVGLTMIALMVLTLRNIRKASEAESSLQHAE